MWRVGLDAVGAQRVLGGALGDPPVRRRPRDDDVVALADVERAEHRLDPRPAALDVDALVADPVAVPRARRAGHGIRDAHVAVAEHEPASGDDVGPLDVLGVEQVVQPEVPRHQRVVRRRRQVADRPLAGSRRWSRGCCGGRAARSPRRSPPPPSAPRSRAPRTAGRGRAAGAGCAAWAGCCPAAGSAPLVHLFVVRPDSRVDVARHVQPGPSGGRIRPGATLVACRHDIAVGSRCALACGPGPVCRTDRRRGGLPARPGPAARGGARAPPPPHERVCRPGRPAARPRLQRGRGARSPAARRRPAAHRPHRPARHPTAHGHRRRAPAAREPPGRGRRGGARLDAGVARPRPARRDWRRAAGAGGAARPGPGARPRRHRRRGRRRRPRASRSSAPAPPPPGTGRTSRSSRPSSSARRSAACPSS